MFSLVFLWVTESNIENILANELASFVPIFNLRYKENVTEYEPGTLNGFQRSSCLAI